MNKLLDQYRQLVAFLLMYISFNCNAQQTIDYYFVHYRNIVSAKVVKVQKRKIKLETEESYKGSWNAGSGHKIKFRPENFESQPVKDSSYIFVLGGHNSFGQKWILRSSDLFFGIRKDSVLIPNSLLTEIRTQNDSLLMSANATVTIVSKSECVDLIKALNDTFSYEYAKRRIRWTRTIIKTLKKKEIPDNLTPFQRAVFQHFEQHLFINRT